MKKQVILLGKAAIVTIVCTLIIALLVAVMLRFGIWESQKAYIYRLLAMCFGSCVLLIAVSVVLSVKHGAVYGIEFSTQVMCIGLAGLFMCFFFVLGPMVIERSYTVYSLAYMTDFDKSYTYEEIRDQFVTGYVDGGATKMRIEEQVSIGNLEQIGDKYKITEKGKSLIQFMRLVEKIFPVPDTGSIYPSEIGN